MSGRMLELLRARRFGPLFLTQLLGAFNDNLFKSALVVALTFGALRESAESVGIDVLVNLATGLLVLPFFLFSATAGQLADRFDKAQLTRWLKRTELAVMSLAVLGFALGSVPLLFASLFAMGAQSAFFGPVKYAILPQHLPEEELVRANGLIEMGTFVAILAGTLVGALVVALPGVGLVLLAAMLVLVAAGGMVSAARIPAAPGSAHVKVDRNPVRATKETLAVAWKLPAVRWSILGASWFWLAGAFVLGQMPRLAERLGAAEGGMTWLLAAFSVGIGVGSVATEKLARGRIELGMVPAAGLAMAGALVGLAYAPTLLWACLAVTAFGLAGGVFIVPLYALMQRRAHPDETSRVVAANNIVNAAFMVVAALYAMVRLGGGASLPRVVLEIAAAQALVSLGALYAVRRDALRLLFGRMVRTLYRVDAEGFDRIPAEGAALVVANHESFVDAFVVGGLAPRTMRFVMDHRMAKVPGGAWFFRLARSIPIAPKKEDPAMLQAAMDEVDRALANGELVCLFPEGKCTRDGEVDVFRRGVERILARRRAAGQEVPIVPVGLRGLWGGFFSYARGYPMKQWPRRFRARVRAVVGEALPSTTSADALRRRCRELRGEVLETPEPVSAPSRRAA